MAIAGVERQIGVDQTRGPAILWSEIGDGSTRISLRVGELLSYFAQLDLIFLREIERKGLNVQAVFDDGDGLDLFPNIVVKRIEEVGGKGAVVRAINIGLKQIGNMDDLNGDRDAVLVDLIFMLEQKRAEIKRDKKSNCS